MCVNMAAKKKGKKGGPIDPLSERTRVLQEQIAALEVQIKKLDSQLQGTPPPKFRSTAIPHGTTIPRKATTQSSKPSAAEPVFEEIKLQACAQPEPADRFNEWGIRKYDLPALWERLRERFRRPTTSNPRLVNYLAAGGVQGLRPLRYEKRVARNRVIALALLFLLILFGLLFTYIHVK